MLLRSIGVLLCLCGALVPFGCAQTRSVALRVTDEAGEPVSGASVFAVALGTSDIPLPLTFETLSELLSERSVRASGVTDGRGRVRLTLLDRPAALRLRPSPFDPVGEGAGPWLYTLDPATGRIEAPRDRGNPPGLNLDLAR